MAYRCLDCGRVFEEGEQSYWSESRGEYWGMPCWEEMVGCPFCGGDYEETTPCDICGGGYEKEELSGGVCKHCIDEYRKNFDVCYEVSICETTPIEINSLLASLFEPSDIEAILKKYIKENCQDIDCSRFINEDISWFGEMLAKEVNKDENGEV